MRAYVPPENWPGPEGGLLPADESHHVCRVMRKKPGDEIELLDGEGRVGRAVIEQVDARGRVRIRLLSALETPPPGARSHLIQALAKPQRMDWLVEKCAELGVTDLWPVDAVRSVAHPKREAARKRVERWHKLAVGAAKQCGSDRVMRVHRVRSVEDVLRDVPRDMLWVASLEPGAEDIGRAAAECGTIETACAVGPEGDFSPDEYETIRRAGGRPVSLGDRVLRSETAAVYMAVWMHLNRRARHAHH